MKKFLLPLGIILLLIVAPRPGYAWWNTGHMTVAQIAYDHMQPATQMWVNKLIKQLCREYPANNTFVGAATWPDDIKGTDSIHVYDGWHYTNIPFNPTNETIPCRDTTQADVIWAITQAKAMLETTKTTTYEKGQFLAFLIHFVGDIHQPLHSTSGYTKYGSDFGGNGFKLTDPNHKNLHALWDDGCSYFARFDSVTSGMSPKVWKPILEKISSTIRTAYPPTTIPNVDNLDPKVWAKESHLHAVKDAYLGVQSINGTDTLRIRFKDTPTPLYLQNGQRVVEMRLAAGGYRLAKMLDNICQKMLAKK